MWQHVSAKNMKHLGNISSYNHSVLSKNRNPEGGKMGKSRNRFASPRDNKYFPSPDRYNPLRSMGTELARSAVFKSSARAVMGKSTLDILD